MQKYQFFIIWYYISRESFVVNLQSKNFLLKQVNVTASKTHTLVRVWLKLIIYGMWLYIEIDVKCIDNTVWVVMSCLCKAEETCVQHANSDDQKHM